MRLHDRLHAACDGLRSHALRSALAALGIVIGVAATVAIGMVMQSLAAALNRQFEGLGARTLTARADTSFEDALHGRTHPLRAADVEVLRRLADPRPTDLAPLVTVAGPFGGTITHGSRSTLARIFGTTASYSSLHRLYAASGRFLAADDDAHRRRVCVIGERTRRELGLGVHPEGRFVLVMGEWFKVVGVLEPRGTLLGISRDDDLFIPYLTARALEGDPGSAELVVAFNAPDDDRVNELQEAARRALRQAHQLAGTQRDDFVVETAEQLRATYAALSDRLALGLVAVVGLSLLVSGIGILNIMLVSVTERTREIGIHKALGARDADILAQFLLEAVTLTLLGSLAGVVVGLGLGRLLLTAMPDAAPAGVPWGICALAVGSATAVGWIFGVVPARRAAILPPLVALRHD